MQRHGMAAVTKLGLCALLALASLVQVRAEDAKVDPTGSWVWTQPARGGNGQPREMTLKLKVEGEKLAATLIPPPGRNGNPGRERKIEDAKLKGDELTFTLSNTNRTSGDVVTVKYSGKISGDTLKGKIEREGQDPRDWTAKRKDEKKEEKKEEPK